MGLDRRLRCWGAGPGGRALDATPRKTPEIVAGLPEVSTVAVGLDETCVVTRAKKLLCAAESESDKRAQFTEILAGVAGVAVGAKGACALSEEGRVRCFVHHLPEPVSMSGYASGPMAAGPVQLTDVPIPGKVTQIAGKADVFAARTANGEVFFWDMDHASTPLPFGSGMLARFVSLDEGSAVCAFAADGTVECIDARLATPDGPRAVIRKGSISGIENAVVETRKVGDAFEYTILRTDGHISDMGSGTYRSGRDLQLDRLPRSRAISRYAGVACALDESDTVRCWGSNGGGLIAGSTGTDRWVSIPTMNEVVSITLSCDMAVVRRKSGETFFWGRNDPAPQKSMLPADATAHGVFFSEDSPCKLALVDARNRLSCLSSVERMDARKDIAPVSWVSPGSFYVCLGDEKGRPRCFEAGAPRLDPSRAAEGAAVTRYGPFCALSRGTVRCNSYERRKGNATFPGLKDPVALAATLRTLCVREADGDVWCRKGTDEFVARVGERLFEHATELSCANSGCCALLEGDRMRCFVDVLPSKRRVVVATEPIDVPKGLHALAMSCGTTCGVDPAGVVWCRGACANGQCGPGLPLGQYEWEPVVVGSVDPGRKPPPQP